MHTTAAFTRKKHPKAIQGVLPSNTGELNKFFANWRARGKLYLWQVRRWRRRSFEAYRPIRTLAEYLRAWQMLSRQLNITRARHVARQLVSGKNSVFRRNLHSKGTSYTVLREKHVIQECRGVHKGDWVHFFILSFSFSSLAAAFAAAFASDLAEKDDRLEKLEYSVKWHEHTKLSVLVRYTEMYVWRYFHFFSLLFSCSSLPRA